MTPQNIDQILTEDEVRELPPDVLQLVKVEGTQLTEQIKAIKITNKEAYEKACALGNDNNRVLKRIEDFRKLIVAPLNDHVKNINGIFKKIAQRFSDNDALIRSGCQKYLSSIKNIERVQTTHAETGRASVVSRWVFEVIDETKVPRKYLKPDEVAIGRAVRSDKVREIPGVKIWEEKSPSFARK